MRWSQIGLFCLVAASAGAQTNRVDRNRLGDEEARGAGVRAAYVRTDNVGRAETAQSVDADIKAIGLDVYASRVGSRFNGAVVGDVEYRDYGSEQALTPDDGDEIFGSLDGVASLDLVRDRLFWDFDGTYGQTRANAFLTDRPRNRQGVVVVSTGPQLDLPLGRRTILRAIAQVQNRSFEETSALDSDARFFRLALARAVSRVSQVALEYSSSEVEFEDTPVEQEFEALYVRYTKELATGQIEMRVGEGLVRVAEQETSNVIMSFNWDRTVGARSRLTFSANREFTEAGELFRLGSGSSTTGVGGFGAVGRLGGSPDVRSVSEGRLRDVVAVVNPLERRQFAIGLQIDGRVGTSLLSIGSGEDRFEQDDTYDNDSEYLQFRHRRDLNARWELRAEIHAARRNFLTGREDDDLRSSLVASRELGRRSSVQLGFEHNERETRSGEADSFDENVLRVSFRRELLAR